MAPLLNSEVQVNRVTVKLVNLVNTEHYFSEAKNTDLFSEDIRHNQTHTRQTRLLYANIL